MRRREFITLLGSAAAAWPSAARAQQATMLRIGLLTPAAEGDPQGVVRVFRESLAKLGWEVGRNIRIDYRWGAKDAVQARAFAAELVSLTPHVILAQGSLTSQALLQQTRTIPIVFVNASDPMGSGLVASIARPGGNLTGFTNFEFSIGAKWLEILKEVAPGIKRVLFILLPGNLGNLGLLRAAEAVAPSLGVEPVEAGAVNANETEQAIKAFASGSSGGIVVLPSVLRNETRDLIVGSAMRHGLPAIYPFRIFVESGGLMSYGVDEVELYRGAASYVNRILRGEKPGDLPVQQPTKFELVINLKAAKALQLIVPTSVLLRADEVIE